MRSILSRLITLATDDSRATVCRLGLPLSLRGTLVGDGPLPEDPRVVRHLPWVELLARLTAVADADQPRGNFDVPIAIMIVLSTVFVIQAAFLCYRRRWRRLKLLAVGLVLVTLAMGIVGMYNDSRGMNPIEYYSWSGWYWVAVFGIPLTGLLVLAWRLLVLLIRLVQRAVGRVFLRPAIA